MTEKYVSAAAGLSRRSARHLGLSSFAVTLATTGIVAGQEPSNPNVPQPTATTAPSPSIAAGDPSSMIQTEAAPKVAPAPSGATPAIRSLVEAYCQSIKPGQQSADADGASHMYTMLLSRIPRTTEARLAFRLGMQQPSPCKEAFLSYFDPAETYVKPADLSQTRRFENGQEQTCRLSADMPTPDSDDGGSRAEQCNDTLSGYEMAAMSHSKGRRCSVAIAVAIEDAVSVPVQNAIRRYYKDVAGDDCTSVPSIDCTGISSCWGGPNLEKFGIQGIITANLGTIMGRGFGYAADSTAAANLTTYVGARAFVSSGLVDVRLGIGLGMFPDPDSTTSTLTGGMTFTGGFGWYHGLIALNYLHTRRISDKLATSGNGIGIFIDAATIAKLVDRD